MREHVQADLAQASLRQTRNDRGDPLPAFTGERGSGASPMLRLVRGGWSNLDGARRAGVQKVEYRLDGDTVTRIAYPMLVLKRATPAAESFAAFAGSAKSRAIWQHFGFTTP